MLFNKLPVFFIPQDIHEQEAYEKHFGISMDGCRCGYARYTFYDNAPDGTVSYVCPIVSDIVCSNPKCEV